MSVNKAILKGRLGQNPENNKGVVKFSIATSEKYKKENGEQIEKTQWHNIVAFGKLAEILEKFFSKGDEIFLIGKIEYSEYEGKKYTNIVASEFDFVSSYNKSESQPSQTPPPVDDNLPF